MTMCFPFAIRSSVTGFLLAASSVCLAGGAQAQTIDFVGVGKGISYVQTAADKVGVDPTPVSETYGGAYSFWAEVEGENIGGITRPTVKLPGNSTFIAKYGTPGLYYDALNESWMFGTAKSGKNNWGTTTKAALDALFPAGIYYIKVKGKTVAFNLGADAYPVVPKLTLSGGVWSSGKYYIDVSKKLTLTTNTHTTYNSRQNGVTGLAMWSDMDDVFDVMYMADITPAKKYITRTVSAGTLSPGWNYEVEAYFISVVAESTALAESYNPAYYESNTHLVIVAQAAPRITQQPVFTAISSTLSVKASGTSLTYQWYKNGRAISGATKATYTIPVPTDNKEVNYYVVVKNKVGSVTSKTVSLSATSIDIMPST